MAQSVVFSNYTFIVAAEMKQLQRLIKTPLEDSRSDQEPYKMKNDDILEFCINKKYFRKYLHQFLS